MHNTYTRISNVFSFFTTVVTVIACAIAFIHLLTTRAPDIKPNSLKLHNVQIVKDRPYYFSRKREEFAHIKFDLNIGTQLDTFSTIAAAASSLWRIGEGLQTPLIPPPQTDLSHLFTWNTKQIFLYITATYPSSSSSPTSPPSQSILWDAILPHPNSPAHHNHYIYLPDGVNSDYSRQGSRSDTKAGLKSKRGTSRDRTKDIKKTQDPQVPGLLRLQGQRPKYQITDPSGRLAERSNVTLELNWNIQPWVGTLTWFSAGSESALSVSAWSRLLRYLGTWNRLEAEGARTEDFGFPSLQEKSQGVKVEKGSEGYKLMG